MVSAMYTLGRPYLPYFNTDFAIGFHLICYLEGIIGEFAHLVDFARQALRWWPTTMPSIGPPCQAQLGEGAGAPTPNQSWLPSAHRPYALGGEPPPGIWPSGPSGRSATLTTYGLLGPWAIGPIGPLALRANRAFGPCPNVTSAQLPIRPTNRTPIWPKALSVIWTIGRLALRALRGLRPNRPSGPSDLWALSKCATHYRPSVHWPVGSKLPWWPIDLGPLFYNGGFDLTQYHIKSYVKQNF